MKLSHGEELSDHVIPWTSSLFHTESTRKAFKSMTSIARAGCDDSNLDVA
jgi:hypothetical protein